MKEADLIVRIIVGMAFVAYSFFSIETFLCNTSESVSGTSDAFNFYAGLGFIVLYFLMLLIIFIQKIKE